MVQKGHFWGRKAMGYFTYPHTMQDLEPWGISYCAPGCEVNLEEFKGVLTTGRQQAEFRWSSVHLGLLLLAAIFLVDIDEGHEGSIGFKSL